MDSGVVIKVADDLTGVVDAGGHGYGEGGGDIDGGEGTAIVQESMLSYSCVRVKDLEEADDLTGVVDGESFSAKGAGDIDGGKREATPERSWSETDQCGEGHDAGN